MTRDRPAVVTCMAGGGGFGYGFHMGVLDGAREGGLDLARWPLMGTSAGSHAAATAATDLTFEQVATMWGRYVEQLTAHFGASGGEMVAPMYGPRTADDVTAVAVRLATFRRRLLRSSEYPLTDLVAASSAVWPIVRPHRIDGARYVDGGAVSLASADLAPAADVLVLLCPFAGPYQGIVGRLGAWQANREMLAWQRRHGGDIIQVVPSAEMAALGGRRLSEIGDISIGRAVYPLALASGHRLAAELGRTHPHLLTA